MPSEFDIAELCDRLTKLLMERCDQLEDKITGGAKQEPRERAHKPSFSETEVGELQELEVLSPIKPLLLDDTVNDILINGPGTVFVERAGLLEKTDISFASDEELYKMAETIAERVGRDLDPERPLVDARLVCGSRVNVVAYPLSLNGTTISIRKFSRNKLTLDAMKERANISETMAEFLKVCASCRLNIIISGGTGSGKTTMLNAISQHISPKERVITIEDSAELQLNQPHVVRMETKPHVHGKQAGDDVTIRDLVKNALRMRPDRIIVGEIRGAEAFDMMQAMNTGHEGSMSTIHSNSPRDALSRLENMITMANLNIPTKAIRAQIASALNIVVQIARMRDGHRRITHITEVTGIEGDTLVMQDIFHFIQEGEDADGKVKGKFKWTGIMPRMLHRASAYGFQQKMSEVFGVNLPKHVFHE